MHPSYWFYAIATVARQIVEDADGVLVITSEEFERLLREHEALRDCPSHKIDHMRVCLKRKAGLQSTSLDPRDKLSQPRLVWLDHMSERQARQLLAERETQSATEAVLA